MLAAAAEQARLSSLHRFEILDTPRERAFDEIAELAARSAAPRSESSTCGLGVRGRPHPARPDRRAEAREQVTRLQELDRMRDQFVSTVSHELRSPLTSVRGWIDRLLEEAEAMDPGHVDALVRVSRNTDRLTRVVGDLLDLYHVDTGDLAMRFEPVDLAWAWRSRMRSSSATAGASRIYGDGALSCPPAHWRLSTFAACFVHHCGA